MDSENIIEKIMDYLAGELSHDEALHLMKLLESRPDMARHAKEIMSIWEDMDKAMAVEGDCASILQRVFERVVDEQDQDELSDEDLAKAAGGVSRLTDYSKDIDNK